MSSRSNAKHDETWLLSFGATLQPHSIFLQLLDGLLKPSNCLNFRNLCHANIELA